MKDITFFIPHRLPGLNEVTEANRKNPHAGAKLKKEWTDICMIYAQKTGVQFTTPVEVCFLYLEPNRKRDPDNIVSAKKFILDGMKEAGMIPQDSQKYIKRFGQDDWDVAEKGEQVGVWVQVSEYDRQTNNRSGALGA